MKRCVTGPALASAAPACYDTRMTSEQVLVDVAGDLATVTLNRPDRRNALSESMLRDLGAALARAAEAPGVRAIVLAAAGPVFSAGHDFADMVERDLDAMRRLLNICTEVMLGISRLPVPVVAQVQGIATAAGCQLVASCDLAVAVEGASFATPGGRGGWFCHTPLVAVARAIGTRRAIELGMTGEPITAQTAYAWGLVNRVVPHAQLAAEAQALARAASRGSLASKARGKRTFYDQVGLDIEAAYAEAVEVMATSALTPDGREAMRSFIEKRPSVFPPRS
jgi:enoyl-CoA hydratase/carnithine racemase